MAGIGRNKTLRTEERRDVILQALRAGNTREAAAGYADMSAVTLWRWLKDDEDFQREVARAEATAEVRMATVIADAAFGRPAQYDAEGRVLRGEVKPDPSRAEWWLERRRPHAWGKRIDINVRAIVEQYATDNGLDAGELMAEAERILSEHLEDTRR